MKVFLNGETKEVPSGLDLKQLLEHFSLPSQRVAIELNKTVVRRADWPTVKISDADVIEVIHFVGGG
ncbi:MAG: sulfur carrier protein ThiS [Acidobacteria bacterium]|nr:sulfur carrier protein ThiS [Acidobacteriota bacterium]